MKLSQKPVALQHRGPREGLSRPVIVPVTRDHKALGWRTLYTYTRADEPGTSPRAAGFVEDGRVPASDRAVKNGARARYQENLLGETVDEDGIEKIRWRRDL